MKKPRLREAKSLIWGHMARQWLNHNSSPSLFGVLYLATQTHPSEHGPDKGLPVTSSPGGCGLPFGKSLDTKERLHERCVSSLAGTRSVHVLRNLLTTREHWRDWALLVKLLRGWTHTGVVWTGLLKPDQRVLGRCLKADGSGRGTSLLEIQPSGVSEVSGVHCGNCVHPTPSYCSFAWSLGSFLPKNKGHEASQIWPSPVKHHTPSKWQVSRTNYQQARVLTSFIKGKECLIRWGKFGVILCTWPFATWSWPPCTPWPSMVLPSFLSLFSINPLKPMAMDVCSVTQSCTSDSLWPHEL